MIEVKIPVFMKKEAKRLTELERQSWEGKKLKSRFNTDLITNKFQGYLGELLFSHFLIDRCLTFDWDKSLGKADSSDFLVQGKKIDVKTGLRKKPLNTLNKDTFKLMLNKRQLLEHPNDIYFFILLQGDNPYEAKKAYLVGFVSREKALSFKDVKQSISESVWISFDEVLPPKDLEMML